MLARYVLATCALCCVPCWTFAVGVRPPTRALIGAQRTYVRAMEVQIALALPRAGAAHFPAVGTRASVLLEGLGRLLSARGAALERLDRWMSAFVTARVREEERARTTLRLSADVAGQFTSVTLAPDGKVRRLADDGKYWFSKLYEIITSEEIGQRGLFWDEAYVMHFVPRFYDLYHRALLRYLRGEHDQVSQLWLTHFEVTERVDISLFAHVSQCIESGVRAHIVGDMTEALTTSFRSYVATYRLPSSDLAQHWEDFFPVNRHIFERVKARFFIDLSQQTFPGSVEAGQFAFGAADQIAGLPIDQIYGWRTAAWQQAVAGLEQ
jgi:hypothetical protein